MRLLVISPTKTIKRHLDATGVDYEIVESAALLNKAFEETHGFFDGVIAPSDPQPGVIRTIGKNWYVSNRELPIFVFGNRLTTKQQMAHIYSQLVTFVYCKPLLPELKAWINNLQQDKAA